MERILVNQLSKNGLLKELEKRWTGITSTRDSPSQPGADGKPKGQRQDGGTRDGEWDKGTKGKGQGTILFNSSSFFFCTDGNRMGSAAGPFLKEVGSQATIKSRTARPSRSGV